MKTIKARFRSRGGVHPSYHKDLSADQPIQELPLPPLLRVSMLQHLGAPALPVVKKDDTVLRGQLIGEAAGFISAAVHAPTSGTVKAIVDFPTASGAPAKTIEIEPDGEDRWTDTIVPLPDWARLPSKQLIERVADAGIVGMGGAGFPTHVKLSPPPQKPIDTLIINGAECEPYLTADHRLMVEQADRIAAGACILQKILNVQEVYVAIEDNKPDAIAAMEKAMTHADGNARVCVLKTEYPQGAEKQQIYAITGREVPCGGLPMDVGCLVENVGTTCAVWDAVVNGRPLIERVTSVTGAGIFRPGNILTRVGTPYAELVAFCGGAAASVAKIISGGPMMGLAQATLDIATSKTTSGLLALPREAVDVFLQMPCISCGRCIEACPMELVPCELSQVLEAEDYDAADALGVFNCIECGCCAYACPARRPLVQQMRQGKARVMLKRKQQEQAKK